MQTKQHRWTGNRGWEVMSGADGTLDPQLVLYFAANPALEACNVANELRRIYPKAHLLGCSTAGEICGTEVLDGSVVATAIQFDDTRIRTAYRSIDSPSESAVTGELLARDLERNGLVHAFVLAEGVQVNGSELVKGLRRGLPENVAVTGGLAGDGERFSRTSVMLDADARSGGVAVVGFYGSRLRVGYGSMGGWDPFGPERLITRSEGNILYELDGSSALELYRTYLGEYANDLPASGLLFPLSLRADDGGQGVVRTILGVDESSGSVIFAGDLPQGSYARLMKANVDRLIDGANGAAGASYEVVSSAQPDLAILISCVGRKLVLRQRVEEEVESVRDVLGPNTALTGFYSYGEIAPFRSSAKCELHNQTMTITTLSERP